MSGFPGSTMSILSDSFLTSLFQRNYETWRKASQGSDNISSSGTLHNQINFWYFLNCPCKRHDGFYAISNECQPTDQRDSLLSEQRRILVPPHYITHFHKHHLSGTTNYWWTKVLLVRVIKPWFVLGLQIMAGFLLCLIFCGCGESPDNQPTKTTNRLICASLVLTLLITAVNIFIVSFESYVIHLNS